MSILIKGLKLPPVGIRQCIVSFADNCLLITDVCGKILFESEYVEVPTPHGRLIDADELIAWDGTEWGTPDDVVMYGDIWGAPTIIEAEVSEE
jgi:hypothetical protein